MEKFLCVTQHLLFFLSYLCGYNLEACNRWHRFIPPNYYSQALPWFFFWWTLVCGLDHVSESSSSFSGTASIFESPSARICDTNVLHRYALFGSTSNCLYSTLILCSAADIGLCYGGNLKGSGMVKYASLCWWIVSAILLKSLLFTDKSLVSWDC